MGGLSLREVDEDGKISVLAGKCEKKLTSYWKTLLMALLFYSQ